MSAKVIDGKLAAAELKESIKQKVTQRRQKGLEVPGLATVLVGNDPASQSYVTAKHRACEELGITSFKIELPADTSQEALDAAVNTLANDKKVHGILVQLPLPKGLDEERVLNAIPLSKDVDGFHPINIGRLAQKGREPAFSPCTPSGIIYLLKQTMGSLEGKNAVVIGRSNIVGMPVSLLLLRENATVTICHSRTKDLPSIARSADILVAAIGRAEYVKGDWIKPGAVVIDVGVNRVEDASRKRGYRLVGDVAYEEAMEVASAITPVPGGVGPLTIAMLMQNTLIAAQSQDM
jgi:methylenetetrahydrofolate dehydrogenase (NADP+) / methenyltetrahydrofolate cyclohydrolase